MTDPVPLTDEEAVLLADRGDSLADSVYPLAVAMMNTLIDETNRRGTNALATGMTFATYFIAGLVTRLATSAMMSFGGSASPENFDSIFDKFLEAIAEYKEIGRETAMAVVGEESAEEPATP